MATSPHAAAQTQMAFRLSWSPTGQSTPGVQRHPVSDQDRVPMAHAAQSFWMLANRVWVFQQVEQTRHLPKDPTGTLQKERRSQGRKPTASAGSIDSQSIKTATQGKIKGYDAGKKVNGRKRHLLVDTLGLPICVFVSAADLADRDGLMELLKRYFAAGLRRLRKLWVDGGYRGDTLKMWVSSLKQTHKIDLEVVQRESKGFEVMKWRWVVERTFAWLLNFRRLSKDYEVLTQNSEALIYIAMIHLLIKRLAPKSEF